MKGLPRLSSSLVLAAVCVAAMPAPSFGASFTVTRPDDPTPDGCAPGDCSLREAILEANSLVGPDTISLPSGTYALSIPPDGTPDDGRDGDLDVFDDLTITGAGARTAIIDGGDIDRVFDLLAGFSLDVVDLTIRNGRTTHPSGAGGIMVLGDLTLERVALTDNKATAGSGGGIVVTSSTASATIVSSALTANATLDSNGNGGALLVLNDASTSLTNVTISGNKANASGGGIAHQSNDTTELLYVTVANNTADADAAGAPGGGGGIAQTSGTVSLWRTLVAGNMDASSLVKDPDCLGSIASQSGGGTSKASNLIQTLSANCIFMPGNGDITGQDPLLGPLADNGGPTKTHALVAGSPAINSGGFLGGSPDQRGAPRDKVSPDIGAYELVFCNGGVVDVVATEGNDSIIGTSGPEVILALGGHDSVDAKEGDDKVCAGFGNDSLSGGAGNDSLSGEWGDDVLTGGGGNDHLVGSDGTDRLVESGDVDFILTNGSLTMLGIGSPTTDALDVDKAKLTGGASANDFDVRGFKGEVTLASGEGDDGFVLGTEGHGGFVDGGPGKDRLIYYGKGDITLTNTRILGSQGNDYALSSIEHATLLGSPERNVINASGFTGPTIIRAGGGRDRLVGGPGRDRLTGQHGNDRLIGGKGADKLFGNRGRDRLFGGAGDDSLKGGRDRDRLFGGAGTDRLNGMKGPDRCGGILRVDTFRSCETVVLA